MRQTVCDKLLQLVAGMLFSFIADECTLQNVPRAIYLSFRTEDWR